MARGCMLCPECVLLLIVQALAMGRAFEKRDLFYHVTRDHVFKDEMLFYRFGGMSGECVQLRQTSFCQSLSEVEALLGNDWRPPLHVTIPSLLPQQFEFEARHFRDLTTESHVTDCAQIVVYYWWATQTALSADWDTMGVAWVVRDSFWYASCDSAQRRKQLVGSWPECTLEASSIVLILAQVYNSSNSHWVLRLLLTAPTREYLCLKFDPMCDRPHIVVAS